MRKALIFGMLLIFLVISLLAQSDETEPCIGYINITDGEEVSTEIMNAEGICFGVYDDCDEASVVSGVNAYTVVMHITYGDITNNVNPPLFEIAEHSGYGTCYNPGEWDPGEYHICITADDFVPNSMDYCFDFTITDGSSLDDDIWSPCMSWSNIVEGEELTMSEIGTDNFCCHIDDDCAGADFWTGINVSTVEITLTHAGVAHEITTELMPRPDHYGIGMCFPYEWEPGEYEICVSGADNAGNLFNTCVTFIVTEDPTHEDICSPHFLNPAPLGDCIRGEYAIGISMVDPYDPPECYMSGVDLETIEVWVNLFGDITDQCTFTPLDHGYRIEWAHGDTALAPGLTFVFAVEGDDNAGNRNAWVDTFIVCDDTPDDVIAPCIHESTVSDGATVPLSTFDDYTFCIVLHDDCEPGTVVTGVDPSTIVITCDIDGSLVTFSDPDWTPTEGHGGGVACFLHDDYYAGASVTVCIFAEDHAGNEMEECISFTIEDEVPPVDECPPVHVTSAPISDCMMPDVPVHQSWIDPTGEDCPDASGIDRSSIEVWTDLLGDITDAAFIEPVPSGQWIIGWNPDDTLLEPGSSFVFCVELNDFAGNRSGFCDTFTVCEEDTTPVDLCPPVMVEYWPGDCVLPERALMGVMIEDAFHIEECPIVSGLDLESITVYANDFNITEAVAITHSGGAAEITWTPVEALTPGSHINICVVVDDNAGNNAELCHEFVVCGGDTTEEDTEGPCLHEATTADYGEMDIIPLDEYGYCLVFWDDCDTLPGYYSGVDPESFTATLVHGDVSETFTPEGEPLDYHGGAVFCINPEEWYGTNYVLCYAVSDNAGNTIDGCIHFEVIDTLLPTEDDCEPVRVSSTPGDDVYCIEPDMALAMVIMDNEYPACGTPSGLNIESMEAWYEIHDATIDIIDEMIITETEAGHRFLWEADGLAPGDVINFCIEVSDNAGNRGHWCDEYTVCDTTVEDLCSPTLISTVPEAGCVRIGHEVGMLFIDPYYLPECYATGINVESIAGHIGDASVTEDLLISESERGILVGLETDDFEPGYAFELCVDIADNAGNSETYCEEFTICEDDTLPDDLCAPVMLEFWPGDCVPSIRPTIGVYVEDEFHIEECPVVTGVDGETIVVWANGVNITEAVSVTVSGGAAEIIWTPTEALTPGSTINFCVDVDDMAGNHAELCHSFVVCGGDTIPEDTLDTSAPCADWSFEDDAMLEPGASVSVHLCDICPDADHVTGVSEESIIVTVSDCESGDVYREVPYEITPIYCAGYAIFFGSSFWEAGRCYEVCIYAQDEAGNEYEECRTFSIDGTPPEDITSPCFHEATTADYGEVHIDHLDEHGYCIVVWDDCDTSGDYYSGVDPETFTFTLVHDGITETFPVEGEALDYHGGAIACVNPDEWYIGDYTLCYAVSDYAGNVADGCLHFEVLPSDTMPEDLCPPVLVEFWPGDCAHPYGTTFGLMIEDAFHIEECPIVTGINDESIVVWADSTNITDLTHVSMSGGAATVSWTPRETLIPGSTIHLCVEVEDNAGNYAELCHEFTVCDDDTIVPDTLDTTPPCPDWSFEDDTMLELGTMVSVHLCDACPGADVITGVDSSTIIVTVSDCETGDTYREVPYEIEGIYCAGYAIFFDGSFWMSGHCYEICIYAEDFAGNEYEECRSFVIDGSPTLDTIPPCVVSHLPEHEAVVEEFSVSVTLCDNCAPGGPTSGVDSTSVIIWVNDVAYTPTYIAEVDCGGYTFGLDRIFETPGEYHICVTGMDLADNEVEECWDVTIEGGEITLITPEPGSHTSCDEITIVIGIPHAIPTSFVFEVDGVRYDLRSPGVTSDSTHVYFTPSTPFDEGEVVVSVADYEWSFIVDTSAPEIELTYPAPGTDYSGVGNIRVRIEDVISNVDVASILAILNGHTLIPGMPGVTYHVSRHELIIDLDGAIDGMPDADSISLCVYAADIMDYCDANEAEDCFIIDIFEPLTYTIEGYVTDEGTDDPLSGMIVHLYDYLAPFVPIYETSTDDDGYYSFDVPVGVYSMSVQDYEFEYATEFYLDETNPMEADPIFINADSPDVTEIDYELAPLLVTYYSVSGTVRDFDGFPIEGCYVVAISSDEDEEEWSMTDRTDEHGRYQFLLEEGNYYILAHQMGYMPSFYGGGMVWSEVTPVTVTDDVDGVDITLEEISREPGTWFMRVRILDEDTLEARLLEKPIKGVRFYLEDDLTGNHYATISDNMGYVDFSGVGDGVYSVNVDKVGYEVVTDVYDLNPENLDSDMNVFMRRVTHNINEENINTPNNLVLHACPNPFNPATELSFNIDESSIVTVDISDVNGRVVRSYDMGYLNEGSHSITFRAENLAAGLYMAQVRTANNSAARKLVLIK